jgi:hypothetical protein
VFALLDDWKTYQQAITQLRAQHPYGSHLIKDEAENWKTFLQSKEQADPTLATVINSVFLRLATAQTSALPSGVQSIVQQQPLTV